MGVTTNEILTELGKQINGPRTMAYRSQMDELYDEADPWRQMKEITHAIDEQPDLVKPKKGKNKRSNYYNYGENLYSKKKKKKKKKIRPTDENEMVEFTRRPSQINAIAKAKERAFGAGMANRLAGGELRSVIDPQTGAPLVLPPVYSLPPST